MKQGFITFGIRLFTDKFQYKTAPIKKIVPPEQYGMDDSWYGGNVKCLAELKHSNLILILNKELQVIDIGVNQEHLRDADMNTLKEYAKKKGIEFSVKITKDELVKRILGEV